MAVDTSWTAPTGATLDLAAGAIVGETNWDALVSNVNRLGGTDGNAKTGPYELGATAYSNAWNTTGLTVQQGTADDEAVSLKSTDVAHGMTGLTETNTYLSAGKQHVTNGGGLLRGWSGGVTGLRLVGYETTSDTTRATTSTAAVMVEGQLKSGTTAGSHGANANVFAVRDDVNTRLILDFEGDLHLDATSNINAWDAYDDVQLVRALEVERAPDSVIRDEFDRFLKYNRRDLETIKIATFNDGPGQDGSIFVNYTGLARLHSGAIWQLAKRLMLLEQHPLLAAAEGRA